MIKDESEVLDELQIKTEQIETIERCFSSWINDEPVLTMLRFVAIRKYGEITDLRIEIFDPEASQEQSAQFAMSLGGLGYIANQLREWYYNLASGG